ncbi:cysteine peptidase family C39 domain-containing protein [Pseudoroseomonas wenyumeiae]
MAGGRSLKPLRTPVILQMEAAECGAAALAIVLATHGLWLPLEELRARCGVSRDGSRAANIARAGRALGMEVQAFRAEPEALAGLRPPAILHWGMDHFVVLEGGGGRRWFINDPARGRREVGAEEFSRQFTGVVLSSPPARPFVALASRLPCGARCAVGCAAPGRASGSCSAPACCCWCRACCCRRRHRCSSTRCWWRGCTAG